MVHAADAPRAAALVGGFAHVDDAGGVVEAVARPAVLFGEPLEAQHARSGTSVVGAERLAPRVARRRGRAPGAPAGPCCDPTARTVACAAPPARRAPAAGRADRRAAGRRSPNRVAMRARPWRRTSRAAVPSNSRLSAGTSSPTSTASPWPMRGGAICAHGKNVRSVPGMSFRVGIEEVVGARVVLVDALLDQAHAEHAAVEVEVLLRRPGDGGDVVQSVDGAHVLILDRCSRRCSRGFAQKPLLAT